MRTKTCPVPHRRRPEMRSSSCSIQISTVYWTCPISRRRSLPAIDSNAHSAKSSSSGVLTTVCPARPREKSPNVNWAHAWTGILANDEKIKALRHLDEFGLLEVPEVAGSIDEILDADPLGLLADDTGVLDVSGLPARKKLTPANDVAHRHKATGFEEFEPLFKRKHAELVDGSMRLVPSPVWNQSPRDGSSFSTV